MILDGAFPPDPRVENEALFLLDHGFNVCLLCFDNMGNAPVYESVQGIHVHRIRVSPFILKLSALAYTLPFYHLYLGKRIHDFIREQEPDALHIHDMQVARSVFRANRGFDLPVVLDLHENRPEIMKYYRHVRSVLGRLTISPGRWKKFERKYILKAERVIVVTNEARDHYLGRIETDPQKFHVVPNTVRKAFFTEYTIEENITRKYSNSFTVLYIGETGMRRGIDIMINALPLVKDKIPEIKLVIVGKSSSDQVYRDMITHLDLGDYVDLVGWQDPSLFQSYIKASALGTCPIHKNIHHDTTYANKIFMYMAFGKPVIVSDCEAQANMVEKYQCGLVFQDRNVKDFAEKLVSIYSDGEYEKMALNAQKAVGGELYWELRAGELKNLYNTL